ncbi:23S rRNA (uracil(1939)-C(5))-methyltransferase RlmD [Erysipelothrix sp. HDW6C]|uniref:23S rRNA (uracil(1939)-C(5))-methyltransferase RlmD n=1 Tax=Erysipelothrix sp. HDW6C TaxID=2714930 RepID=UPI001F1041BD|nr:23S rRNA (uracil(1939)-C(5))-methyltransferase RlmD [Erysipelothrix sp. HDW6C]
MIKKNKEYELEIIDLTYEGFGVAKIDGFPVFIENTLPQEIVNVVITKVLRKFAYGRALEIITPSPDRVEITDKVGTRIGTMPLQHMSYDLQLRFKQKMVRETLAKEIDMSGVEVHETLGMETPWGYRNKAQIPVRMIEGQLETGFFKRGTHSLIPIENYHIQDPKIDEAILKVRDILRSFDVHAYDENKHSGVIRHIIVRRGQFSEDMMIILVTNGNNLKPKEAITNAIQEAIPHLVSLVQNINAKKTNVIMGEENVVLYGNDFYTDDLMGKKFCISSQSFYQVNSKQTEVLYQKAIDLAELKPTDTVIDAYCGIGTISLNLAQHAKHVYGVEIVPDAIVMAKFNAIENNISNATFEVGKAEEVMVKWVEEGLNVDVLVVDPPRRGLDPQFIEASLKTTPKRIVYVSCNPATLTRDLAVYLENGYELMHVQPVDMFPQTVHVEVVISMTLKNVD